MKKKKEEYGKIYLTEFVFRDSLEISAFNEKLAGYFRLQENRPSFVKAGGFFVNMSR